MLTVEGVKTFYSFLARMLFYNQHGKKTPPVATSNSMQILLSKFHFALSKFYDFFSEIYATHCQNLHPDLEAGASTVLV